MNRALTLLKTTLLGFTGMLMAVPAAAQLRCNTGSAGVMQLACKDSDVRRLIRQIDILSKRRGCNFEQAHELAIVRRAWGRRQFGCHVALDVKACLIPELRVEIDYFRQFDHCDVDAHPIKFDVVEPSYVLAHPEIYAGTETSVMGTVTLDSCEPGSPSVAGSVLEYKSEHRAIAVEFKSMPDVQRRFLCEKRPMSAWEGTVRMRPGHIPYLYASDVLGVALP